MLDHSPIIHVDKVKIPTMMLLGSKDIRVTVSLGKLWYNRLTCNNVKTKMLICDDDHMLQKNEVEIDYFINAVIWFVEHNNVIL